MVDYATTAMQEFRVGHVLSRSFSTLFRNILPFGLLALVISAPPYVYNIVFGGIDSLDPMNAAAVNPIGDIIVTISQFLLAYLLTAALVYGTIQDLRGREVNVGECFGKGISMIFPVLGVAIVSLLLVMLGFLALIVPGFIVITMLWVAIPAAVMERNGLSALSRSAKLTKGYRWKVFGLIVLLYGILIVLTVGVGVLMAVFEDNITLQNALFMGVVALFYLLPDM